MLTEVQIIFIIFIVSSEKMNLYRDTFHKYISVMAKRLALFRVSIAQSCASHSATYSDDVLFINYTIILTIIITQMRMT